MKISIIISCFNSQKTIEQCIASLYASTFTHFEVIVVDNGSVDQTLSILNRLHKTFALTILHMPANLGASRARNIAAAQSTGSLLFFLDHDTIVDKHCLKEIGTFFLHHTASAVQCKLLTPSGTIDSLGHHLSLIGFPYEIQDKHDAPFPILGAKTAGLIIKKSLFKRIGGFDEDYLISAEDTDISWRIWLANNSLYSLPSAKIIHHSNSNNTRSIAYQNRILYEGAKNLINMILKNADKHRLIFLLPANIIAWIVLSIKYLFLADLSSFFAIYRGIWWNIMHIPKTLRKRKKQRFHDSILYLDHALLFGTIPITTLIKKGWRWVSHV